MCRAAPGNIQIPDAAAGTRGTNDHGRVVQAANLADGLQALADVSSSSLRRQLMVGAWHAESIEGKYRWILTT